MDERPEPGNVLAVVRIDARRCELHQQCEGLSDTLFASPGQQLVVHEGGVDLRHLERLVRSCPMGALELDVTPSEAPENAR
ncbi:hypothetical protein [Streptomyces sp. H27-S2]|uniref:hypothetical protein n=1 Tax=Streptomyces antarcticus TaxID=2996458 RepID=UPI00226D58E3|nr:hypothetical protein [Streptomyces sp. H27-S2]MCY0947973.1 hypothetical protein [Streptomyces sp. H27-S2]